MKGFLNLKSGNFVFECRHRDYVSNKCFLHEICPYGFQLKCNKTLTPNVNKSCVYITLFQKIPDFSGFISIYLLMVSIFHKNKFIFQISIQFRFL